MKFDEDFPKRVASARAQLGITQTQLAEMVGVVQRQIAAYETVNQTKDGVIVTFE